MRGTNDSPTVPLLPHFQAIDGEGTNREDGSQSYTLLCSSSGRYAESYSDSGLSTYEVFRFLLESSVSFSGVFVGFFIGYDVTKWLHDLSPRHLTALWEAGWVVWKHDGVPYLIEWLPDKIFTLSICSARLSRKARYSKRNTKPKTLPSPRITIYDVGGFFQCSFVKALEEWGVASPDEVAEIAKMKELRNDFATLASGGDGRTRIREYCLSECRSLEALMDILARTLWNSGIYLTSWHGAGAVAGQLFKTYQVKKYLPPQDAARAAIMGAYFGGRTEVYRQGLIDKPLYVYDLNSAYPTALVDIPDLSCCWWEWKDEYDEREQYALWDTCYDTREDGLCFGPLPYRRDGRMFYPFRGRTWAHACELSSARKVFDARHFSVRGGWVLAGPRGDTAPFAFVRELAAARLAYKRDNDERHRVLKLGLNSLYGKLAQKQKSADRLPPYQNHYLAGYVTAYTRARLLPALAASGAGLTMVATDGIFTTERIRVDEGPNLGQWEVKGPYENVLALQSGVLFTPEDQGDSRSLRRTRGFNKSTLEYNELLCEWRRNGHHGLITYHESRFLGLGAGYARHDMGLAGRWLRRESPESRRELVFRLWPQKFPNTNPFSGVRRRPELAEDGEENILLIPNDQWLGCDDETPMEDWPHSDPYIQRYAVGGDLAKMLAEKELALHEFKTQPDWSDSR